jgi:conjugal transfer pilin signal peptidase TrbI
MGLSKGALALLAVYLPLAWFAGHYRLVYDGIRGENCLPYSVFLIELGSDQPQRGEYLAFSSRQMEPFYANGTAVVKQVAAVPGDRVTVDRAGVSINGEHVGELLHLEPGQKLWAQGRRLSDVEREEVVPRGHWWMMGTHPRSYDSRYWGFISADQVVGRAIPLW